MTNHAHKPSVQSVVLVTAGHHNSTDNGPPASRAAIDSRPELVASLDGYARPRFNATSPPRTGLHERFEPSGADRGRVTRPERDQAMGRAEGQRLGPDQVAHAEFRDALAELDERLSLADCRQLAAITDINFQMGQLADQQDRMAAAYRQLAEELRGELHRSLEASRVAWEAALARLEERTSQVEQQGLVRHRQLVQAMARMVQPFADLHRDLDRPSTGLDEHPARRLRSWTPHGR